MTSPTIPGNPKNISLSSTRKLQIKKKMMIRSIQKTSPSLLPLLTNTTLVPKKENPLKRPQTNPKSRLALTKMRTKKSFLKKKKYKSLRLLR